MPSSTPAHHRFPSRLQSFLIPSSSSHKERNYPSAACCMFAVAALVIGLFDSRWFWLNGGLCNSKYIGLNMFFTVGKLYAIHAPIPWDSSAPNNNIYQFKPNDYLELNGCVDGRSILILRLMITMLCLAVISSTMGFFLDATGSMKERLKVCRRLAFWQILSVLLCTVVIGLCFYVSELLYRIQDQTRSKIGKKIEVQFDKAYYLLVIANGLLVLSITFVLLRKYPTEEDEHAERLIDDWSRREPTFSIERSLPAVISPSLANNVPPPDYYSDEDYIIL